MSSTTDIQVPSVRLGKSGLKVSKIILGFMSYGSPEREAWILGQKEATEHVKLCLELGINTFDTADTYSEGDSERLLGQALRDLKIPREEVVILTKCYFGIRPSHTTPLLAPSKPNQSGLSRKHIFAAIKGSLERLGLEYVDVLQCHRFDNDTPIEETMQALHDVVQAGYARYIGMSSCYAYQFQLMQQYAISHNLTPFISMQNFHNAAYREEEREMMPTLKHFGVGCIPWSPLARGYLTRPAGGQTARAASDPWVGLVTMGEEKASALINQAVEKVAKSRNVSMAQVALAWSLSKPGITAPIVGTTKVENIIDLAKGASLVLTPEEIAAIDENYTPRAIIGHW